ncbi:hypothetical protein [Armatimonas sp.]|uniref:hypothetical protein n=1 Tax=Armatimonas sp. TaxID=1872638 RepID=UPI003752689A
MLFVTLAFGAIVSTMVTGIQAGRRGREYQVAGLVARQVVENIRGFKEGGVANGTYSNATTLGVVPQLTSLTTASVSASVTTFNTRCRQVVVTVNWYSVPARRNISQVFTTLFSSDGVAK